MVRWAEMVGRDRDIEDALRVPYGLVLSSRTLPPIIPYGRLVNPNIMLRVYQYHCFLNAF
jgi:hypothetical protein